MKILTRFEAIQIFKKEHPEYKIIQSDVRNKSAYRKWRYKTSKKWKRIVLSASEDYRDNACKKTRENAFNNGNEWKKNECDFILKWKGEKTAKELALALGRTYYAVEARFKILKK
jgi:hypothetical protein